MEKEKNLLKILSETVHVETGTAYDLPQPKKRGRVLDELRNSSDLARFMLICRRFLFRSWTIAFRDRMCCRLLGWEPLEAHHLLQTSRTLTRRPDRSAGRRPASGSFRRASREKAEQKVWR